MSSTNADPVAEGQAQTQVQLNPEERGENQTENPADQSIGPLERIAIIEDELRDLGEWVRGELLALIEKQKRRADSKAGDLIEIDGICARLNEKVIGNMEDLNRGIRELDDVDVGQEAWKERDRQREMRKMLEIQLKMICETAGVEDTDGVRMALQEIAKLRTTNTNQGTALKKAKEDLRLAKEAIAAKEEEINTLLTENQQLADGKKKEEKREREEEESA